MNIKNELERKIPNVKRGHDQGWDYKWLLSIFHCIFSHFLNTF